MIRGVLKDSGLMMLADGAIAFVTGFLLVPLYTRNMSADVYGIVVVVRSIAGVLLPLLLFSASAYMRYYYDYEDGEKPKFSGTVLLLTMGLISVMWLLALLLAPWLQHTFLTKIPVAAIYWAFGITSLDAFRSYLDTSLRLKSRFLFISLTTWGQLIVCVVLSVWLVREAHLGFNGWAVATATASASSCLAFWPVVRRQVRLVWLRESASKVVSFSWPLLLAQFAWFVMNRSDVLFLQRYRSLSETAIYGVAYSTGSLLFALVVPLDKVMAPLFYREIGKEGGPAHWCRLTTLIICAVSAAATTLCIVAPIFYKLLFPATYAAGLIYLPLIVWAFVCRIFDVFFGRTLLYREKTVLAMAIQLASAVLNLGLNYFLIARYGAPAAAASTLAAFALNTSLYLTFGTAIMPLKYEYWRIGLAVGTGVGLTAMWQLWALAFPSAAFYVAAAAVLSAYFVFVVYVGRIPVWRECVSLVRRARGCKSAA